eukprot:Clim_evm45s236 gene=Clim_evmTU45s236
MRLLGMQLVSLPTAEVIEHWHLGGWDYDHAFPEWQYDPLKANSRSLLPSLAGAPKDSAERLRHLSRLGALPVTSRSDTDNELVFIVQNVADVAALLVLIDTDQSREVEKENWSPTPEGRRENASHLQASEVVRECAVILGNLLSTVERRKGQSMPAHHPARPGVRDQLSQPRLQEIRLAALRTCVPLFSELLDHAFVLGVPQSALHTVLLDIEGHPGPEPVSKSVQHPQTMSPSSSPTQLQNKADAQAPLSQQGSLPHTSPLQHGALYLEWQERCVIVQNLKHQSQQRQGQWDSKPDDEGASDEPRRNAYDVIRESSPSSSGPERRKKDSAADAPNADMQKDESGDLKVPAGDDNRSLRRTITGTVSARNSSFVPVAVSLRFKDSTGGDHTSLPTAAPQLLLSGAGAVHFGPCVTALDTFYTDGTLTAEVRAHETETIMRFRALQDDTGTVPSPALLLERYVEETKVGPTEQNKDADSNNENVPTKQRTGFKFTLVLSSTLPDDVLVTNVHCSLRLARRPTAFESTTLGNKTLARTPVGSGGATVALDRTGTAVTMAVRKVSKTSEAVVQFCLFYEHNDEDKALPSTLLTRALLCYETPGYAASGSGAASVRAVSNGRKVAKRMVRYHTSWIQTVHFN